MKRCSGRCAGEEQRKLVRSNRLSAEWAGRLDGAMVGCLFCLGAWLYGVLNGEGVEFLYGLCRNSLV